MFHFQADVCDVVFVLNGVCRFKSLNIEASIYKTTIVTITCMWYVKNRVINIAIWMFYCYPTGEYKLE